MKTLHILEKLMKREFLSSDFLSPFSKQVANSFWSEIADLNDNYHLDIKDIRDKEWRKRHKAAIIRSLILKDQENQPTQI